MFFNCLEYTEIFIRNDAYHAYRLVAIAKMYAKICSKLFVFFFVSVALMVVMTAYKVCERSSSAGDGMMGEK